MAKNIVLKISQKGARKTAGLIGGLTKKVGGLATKVGVVSAGFAILSVKLAGDFQKSLLEVSTLMSNVNEKTLPNLSRELRSVASASGLALSSLSKAKYDIVSAGFSNAAESAKLLDVSSKLAVGGVTSAAAAADLLTTSLNAFGLESDSADRISDALFTTVKLGKTTMDELASSMGQVLPFAKSMNLSFEDVGASMATLTASGISTAEATTALRATITALSAPSDGAKRAMDEAGISVKKFDDGTVDLMSTIEQFKGIDQATIKKFIPNVRAILGVQTLANNFNVLSDNVNEFATESAGATQIAFDKMGTAFNTTFAKLKNNIQNVMIEIGNVIIRIIQPKIDEANEIFSQLGDIGWDIIGETLNNNVSLIFNLMKMTISIVFQEIESRAELMGLKIKNSLQDIIPFAGDSLDEINTLTKKIAEDSITNAEKMKASISFVYGSLIQEAQGRADAEIAIDEEMNVKKRDGRALFAEEESLINEISDDDKKTRTDSAIEYINMEQFAKKQFILDLEKLDEKYKQNSVSREERDKAYSDAVRNFETMQVNAKADSALEMLGIIKGAASKNKEFAKVQKAVAIGEATINAYKATSEAFAKYGGFPGGVVPAALTLATGLATVGEISKTEFADGGIVPGVGNQDTVPAMLTPGEVILNQAQQENLVDTMGVTVNINGNVIGNEEFVRDMLIPEIQKGINLA